MLYRHAKNLHNEDEVRLKDCGKVARVISARVDPEARLVRIELIHPVDGYRTVTHRDVD